MRYILTKKKEEKKEEQSEAYIHPRVRQMVDGAVRPTYINALHLLFPCEAAGMDKRMEKI